LADVVTTTICDPNAAVAPKVMVAVNDVPSPFTNTFEAVMFESMAPALVTNVTPVTPSRFTPVIVMVKFVPFDADAGETD